VFLGDVVVNPTYPQMISLVASQDPYMVFMGGDIGYDNGFNECYCIMDWILDYWEKGAIWSDGAMIPFATSAGNHDLGLEAFA